MKVGPDHIVFSELLIPDCKMEIIITSLMLTVLKFREGVLKTWVDNNNSNKA